MRKIYNVMRIILKLHRTFLIFHLLTKSRMPKLLLADEPTGNLDSLTSREITDLLLKINEFGTTVVLVTHNRDVVNSLKRRVITLEKGEIVSDQPVGRYVL